MEKHKFKVLLWVWLVGGMVVGCSGGKGPKAHTGTLETWMSGVSARGIEYRLRQAVFSVTGTAVTSFSSEDNLNMASVNLSLSVGNYQMFLAPGWNLERREGNAYVKVVATLSSVNPVLFEIKEQQTTKVVYRFVVDGDTVTTTGKGTAEVSIEVVESDAGPPDAAPPDVVPQDTRLPDVGSQNPSFEMGAAMLVGEQPGYSGSYITSGDVDGDGWPDIAMAHGYRVGGLALNKHGKQFAPEVTMSETWWNSQNRQGATSVTLADLDSDGKLDYVFGLYGADYTAKAIQVYQGDGKGNHAIPPGLPNGLVYELRGANPLATRVADFDHNGLMDIISGSNNGAHTVDLILQKSAWVFTPTYAYNHDGRSNPQWIEIGDLNNDGWMDLVAPFMYGSIEVHLNTANGTGALAYSGSYVSPRHHQVAVADLNKDGFADIVARGNVESHVVVLYNDKTGKFPTSATFAVSGSSGSVSAGDIDGDGALDLVLCSTSSSMVDILMNNGTGSFRPAISIPIDEMPYVLNLNDFDQDGDVDVAVYTSTNNVTDHLRILWNRRIP